MSESFIVAGCRPWNRKTFEERLKPLPGTWHFISRKEELTLATLEKTNPRYIFFLHWSYLVPDEVLKRYECICFHMTDLPYGRGGTPLQNLILRGHKETKLTAFRMVREIDAGPVYLKKPLSLDGTAEEIYIRAAEVSADLIEQLIKEPREPKSQVGQVVSFTRRKPQESLLPKGASLGELYDFIRMVDADQYPRAYLEYGGLRLEFSNARLDGERLTAAVNVTLAEEESNEDHGSVRASRR